MPQPRYRIAAERRKKKKVPKPSIPKAEATSPTVRGAQTRAAAFTRATKADLSGWKPIKFDSAAQMRKIANFTIKEGLPENAYIVIEAARKQIATKAGHEGKDFTDWRTFFEGAPPSKSIEAGVGGEGAAEFLAGAAAGIVPPQKDYMADAMHVPSPRGIEIDNKIENIASAGHEQTERLLSPEKVMFLLGTPFVQTKDDVKNLFSVAPTPPSIVMKNDFILDPDSLKQFGLSFPVPVAKKIGEFYFKPGEIEVDAPWEKDFDNWLARNLLVSDKGDVYAAQQDQQYMKPPGLRDLGMFFDVQALEAGKVKLTDRAKAARDWASQDLARRGFTGDYETQLGAMVEANAWADSVILKDPKATRALQLLGAVPAGKTPRQALYDFGMRGEDVKRFLFDQKFRAKPAGMSDTEFFFWYDRTYRKPTQGAETVITTRTTPRGSGMVTKVQDYVSYTPKEILRQIGAVRADSVDIWEATLANFGIDVKIRGPVNDDIVVFGRDEITKKPAWTVSYYPEIDGSLNEVVATIFQDLGKVVAEPFIAAENIIISGAWLLSDYHGKRSAMGINGAMKWYFNKAESRRPVEAIAEIFGMDVKEHKGLLAGIQILGDFALGFGLDGLIMGGYRAIAKAPLVDAVKRSTFKAARMDEVLAGTENPWVIEQLADIPLQEAVAYKGMTDPRLVRMYWELGGGKAYTPGPLKPREIGLPGGGAIPLGKPKFRPNWTPDTRSVQTMHLYNKLNDPEIPTIQKMMFTPLEHGGAGLIDDGSNRMFTQSVYSGVVTPREATAWAGEMADLRYAAMQNPASRGAMLKFWDDKMGREGVVAKRLSEKPATHPRFKRQWKGGEPGTMRDEYEWFHRKFYDIPEDASLDSVHRAFWGVRNERGQFDEMFTVLDEHAAKPVVQKSSTNLRQLRDLGRRQRALRAERVPEPEFGKEYTHNKAKVVDVEGAGPVDTGIARTVKLSNDNGFETARSHSSLKGDHSKTNTSRDADGYVEYTQDYPEVRAAAEKNGLKVEGGGAAGAAGTRNVSTGAAGDVYEPWNMTSRELDLAAEAERTLDRTAAERILGPEDAKDWRTIERIDDNPLASKKDQAWSTKRRAEIEGSLTKEQEREFFGMDLPETYVDVEELRGWSQVVHYVETAETPSQLAASLKNHAAHFNPDKPWVKMSGREQDAVVAFKTALRKADEMGWDTAAVSNETLARAAQMYGEDAELMLGQLRAFGRKRIGPAAQTTPSIVVKVEGHGRQAQAKWRAFTDDLADQATPPTAEEKTIAEQLAALRGERPDISAEAKALTETRTTPIGEREFAGQAGTYFDDTVLATMLAGPKAMDFALANRNVVLDKLDHVYRTALLAKFSSMIAIPSFDEGLRTMLELGVNPMTLKSVKRYWDKKLKEIVGADPALRQDLLDQFDMATEPMWRYLDADSPDISTAAKQFLRHNSGKSANRIFADWGALYRKHIADIGEETAENVAEASRRATNELKETVRKDPFYVGTETEEGIFQAQGVVPGAAARKAGVPDSIDKHIDSVGIIGSRFVSNPTTRRHFFDGESAVKKTDFRNADVRNVYDGVSYITRHGKRRMDAIESLMGGRPIVGSAATGITHPVDSLFSVMSAISNHQRRYTFTKSFMAYEKYLRNTYKGLDEGELLTAALHHARQQTVRLSYVAKRSFFEENTRRVIMFLPAIRQGLKYWIPKSLQNPYKSMAFFNAWNQLGDLDLGDTEVNIKPTGFFTELNPLNPETFRLPVGIIPALVVETPAALGTVLGWTGSKYFEKAHETLTGGFKAGAPIMRPLDMMVWSVASRNDWLSRVYDTAAQTPAMKGIQEARVKATVTWLVADAMKNGKASAERAKKKAADIEGIRGLWSWSIPIGTLRRSFPTIVVDDGGKKLEVDLAELSKAQALYLAAENETQQADVLKEYPFYKPVAKAYTMRGDEQLEYLSQHRWMIPIVVRKTADIEALGEEYTLTGEEAQAYRGRLSAEEVADEINSKYEAVDKYVIRSSYEEGMADVEAQFKKDARKKMGGKLGPYGVREHAYEDLEMYDSEGWKSLTTRVKEYNASFQKDNGKLLRSLMPKDARATWRKPDEDGDPNWMKIVNSSPSSLDGKAFTSMKAMWDSEDPISRDLVKRSDFWPMFEQRYNEEAQKEYSKKIEAAVSLYKSRLTPDEREAFGLPDDIKTNTGVQEYLQTVRRWRGKLDKHKVFSDEWKAAYRGRALELRKLAFKGPGSEVLKQSTVTLLAKIGLPVENPIEFIKTERPGATETQLQRKQMAEWNKFKPQMKSLGHDVIYKDNAEQTMVKLRKEYDAAMESPYQAVKDAADEAMRAWTWRVMLVAAKAERSNILNEYNKWTTAPGFSAGSKYFDESAQWLKDVFNVVAYDKKKKRYISESFGTQWGEVNDAAGGNLVYDLLDPSK